MYKKFYFTAKIITIV